MDTFGKHFTDLIKAMVGDGKKYQNYRHLAREVGTSPNTFTYLSQDKTKNPDPELLRRISKALTGEEQYLPKLLAEARLGIKAMTQTEFHNLTRPDGAASPWIPVLSLFSPNGDPLRPQNHGEVPFHEFIPSPDGRLAGNEAFALRVQDDSMAPRYILGDYVIVAARRAPIEGRPVIFCPQEGQPACRLWQESDHGILFIPVNIAFPIITLKREQLAWIYPVYGIYRKEI